MLDDTILYPEGGGQPCDRGRLDGVAVVAVRRVAGRVLHFLESPVAKGPARLELDWRRRFDHMQQHTAQHVLSAVAGSRFGWSTLAFHLGDDSSDVELDTPPPPSTELERLEEAVVAEVRAARAVRTRRVPPQEYARLEVRSRGLPAGHRGDVRLVEIEGLDLNTCGGTHVRNTAEIETFKVVAAEPLRGGCRLGWLAGGRVRRRLSERDGLVDRLRARFDTSAAELDRVVATRLESLATAERQLRRLEQRLAEAEAARLAATRRALAEAHFEEVDGGFLHLVARSFQQLAPDGAVLLTGSGPGGLCFALASGKDSALRASVAGQQLCELLAGRGGGSGRLYQGRAGSLERRAEAVAALRRLVADGDLM